MNSTARPLSVRVALITIGVVAISCTLLVENHAAIRARLDVVQQPIGRRNSPVEYQPQRLLLSHMPDDEETQVKQMKSYFGGLYPPVDKDMMPLYLRNTLDTESVLVMDLYHTSGEPVVKARDPIFFWHIPRAAGSTMKNIMNFCFDLKRAEKLSEEPDTSTQDGLVFSFANQVVNSDKVDVIVSNYFLSGSALFTNMHNGRTFTILRHPIDLAQSLFYSRRKYRKDWQNLSFHDYASSPDYMDGWMVRQLTGTMPWVELTEKHLERAKKLMKQKIFVGILSEMDETSGS